MNRIGIATLITYTDDIHPLIRAYMFLGLVRTNIDKNMLQQIILKHANDTVEFSVKSVDVLVKWKVIDFMKMVLDAKSQNKLRELDYLKEVEKISSKY